MSEKARVFSDTLQGITAHHDLHRKLDAPMHSTGYLAFRPIIDDEVDFTNLIEWLIEYRCEVCNTLIYESDSKYFDLVRGALKQNGYLPS